MSDQVTICTPEELMAVIISREVRDFETIGVGAASPIPAAGCILAEQLQAPHITLIILGSKEYYPFPAGSSELHFLAQRGDLDLFFLSGRSGRFGAGGGLSGFLLKLFLDFTSIKSTANHNICLFF